MEHDDIKAWAALSSGVTGPPFRLERDALYGADRSGGDVKIAIRPRLQSPDTFAANMRFHIAARQAVPDLLKEVIELRKTVTELTRNGR